MLCRCFFLLVLDSPVRKTSGRLSRDCLVENQGVFVINYRFRKFKFSHISWNFSKSARKCFHFFRQNDRPMSADSEKPNIIGGNWMKYCTVAKSVGRRRPIWTSVVVCARAACALRPVRSIPVGIFLNHDAQSAAQTTSFWLRSELP